jgi:Ca2+-binding EF-hand superfamily protein
MANIQEILNDPAKLREVTKAAFDQIDVDNSRKIDRNELKRGLGLVAQEGGFPAPDDADIDRAMNSLDTDRSGFIEIAEFEVLIEELLKLSASA